MPLVTLFDHLPLPPSARFEVRTAKRRQGAYAAQVWTDNGFFTAGVFPTIPEAQRAAADLAATNPVEPEPGTPREQWPSNWTPKRSDQHAPRYKNVRKVKGLGAWQSRIWCGSGPDRGTLNLGIFTFADHGESSEWAAAQVSKAFVREWKPGRTVGEVVKMLKRSKKPSERVPEHVVVPERQRNLLPPTNVGPQRTRAEHRADRARELVTLMDFVSAA